MKKTNSDLPPKLQTFTSLLDAQPPEVQEAFQFLVATAMMGRCVELEDGECEHLRKARI